MSKNNYPGFCVLPFMSIYSQETGDIKPCCEYDTHAVKNPTGDFEKHWNGDFYQQLRTQFNQRQIPSSCKICVMDEQEGIESKRQYSNRLFESYTKFYYNYPTTHCEPPAYYDLRPGNTCNLECVMCNPQSSSAIDERVSHYTKSFHIKPSGITGKDNSMYFDYIRKNADRIEKISLAGGEPFLISEVTELISEQAASGVSKGIDIRFLTNGTVFRSKWISDILTYRSATIEVSLDAVGDLLEYVRYPSRWPVIEKNLKLLSKLQSENENLRIILNPCIHALNFIGFHKLVRTAKQLNLTLNTSLVYYTTDEDYLRVARLNPQQRQAEVQLIQAELEDWHNHNISNSLLKKLSSDKREVISENSRQKFKDLVQYWDSHRETQFEIQFPYLKYLLQE